MRIAIVQGNYIPWRGYFDLMASTDAFIIYDKVQFTKRDWRNRNRILVQGNPQWLTIPCQTAGKFNQAIDETRVMETDWVRKHIATLCRAYAKAPGWELVESLVTRPLSETVSQTKLLSRINEALLRSIASKLAPSTDIIRLQDLPPTLDPSERLAQICERYGADSYVTGPAGLDYLESYPFEERSISIATMDYSNTLKRVTRLQPAGIPPLSVVHDLAMGL